MRFCRACLVALILALGLALAQGTAHADALDDALAHFTAGDFDETDTGICAVASSGSPRAEAILQALQNGQLMFSAEKKAVYIQDDDNKLFDAATGQAVPGDPPADIDTVGINNRLRGDDRRGPRRPDAVVARSRQALRRRTGGIQIAPGQHPADCWTRPSPSETDSRTKRALEEARAAIILNGGSATDADKLAAIAVIRDRGDQDALGDYLRSPSECISRCRASCRRKRFRPIQTRLAAWSMRAKRLVRPFARFGPAARRDRARHHIRRDGRDQYGPRRNGDDRRLRHLRRAGHNSRPLSGACSTIRSRSPFRLLSSSSAASAS